MKYFWNEFFSAIFLNSILLTLLLRIAQFNAKNCRLFHIVHDPWPQKSRTIDSFTTRFTTILAWIMNSLNFTSAYYCFQPGTLHIFTVSQNLVNTNLSSRLKCFDATKAENQPSLQASRRSSKVCVAHCSLCNLTRN